MNIPVIALCDSDSPLNWVDVAIPANNKSRYSIAYMFWLLAREVKQLRGDIPRDQPWDVIVDLFMYRDPDQKKVEAEVDHAGDEEAEAEAEPEGAAVADTMNQFNKKEDGEDEEEEDGQDEAWSTPADGAAATYA